METIEKITAFINRLNNISYDGMLKRSDPYYKDYWFKDYFLLDDDFDEIFQLLQIEFLKGNSKLISDTVNLIDKAIEKLYSIIDFNKDDDNLNLFLAGKIMAAKGYKYKIQDTFLIDKSSSKKTLLSYQWQNTPEDLKELFDKIKSNLIAEDTEWKNFKKVFSGTPVNRFELIKWHDDNATELLFFIQYLESTYSVNRIHKKHERLKACFVKPDGSQFSENLKQLAQNAEITLQQAKQDFIINLF